MRCRQFILTVAFAAMLGGLVGCVQMPTEKQTIVDMRPQISFRFNTADWQMGNALVFVDDREVGRVNDFVDGKSSLRVVPGTHLVRVQHEDKVFLNERVYLADGAVRPIQIK